MRRPPRTFTPCPDFDLTELSTFRRDVLMPLPGEPKLETRARQLTLILAKAFNELKDLSWAVTQLLKGAPLPPPKISTYQGQYIGMRNTMSRMITGIVIEMMNGIREHQQVIGRWAPFQVCVDALPPKAAAAWRDVRRVALGQGGKRTFLDGLWEVRRKVAFHHDGDALLEGFRLHFGAEEVGVENEVAYVSLGNSPEQTRFYFADAASSAFTRDLAERAGIFSEDVKQLANDISFALRFLVEELLKYFDKRASAAESSRGTSAPSAPTSARP